MLWVHRYLNSSYLLSSFLPLACFPLACWMLRITRVLSSPFSSSLFSSPLLSFPLLLSKLVCRNIANEAFDGVVLGIYEGGEVLSLSLSFPFLSSILYSIDDSFLYCFIFLKSLILLLHALASFSSLLLSCFLSFFLLPHLMCLRSSHQMERHLMRNTMEPWSGGGTSLRRKAKSETGRQTKLHKGKKNKWNKI